MLSPCAARDAPPGSSTESAIPRHEIAAASRGRPERLLRRLLQARLRLGALSGLTGAAAAGAIDVVFAVDRLGGRLALLAAGALASSIVLGLARRRAARGRLRAIGGALVVAQGAVLYCHPGSTAEGITAVAWLLVGSMLFFPWGAAAQAAVSASLVAIHVALSWPGVLTPPLPVANLVLAAALSIAGAAVLGRAPRTPHIVRGPRRGVRARRRTVEGAFADRAPAACRGDGTAAAGRLTSDLVATMSHELRTPLNVIMGYNQILAELLPPGDEATRALAAIERAGHELLDLVEATLDLGRLAAGGERPRVEPVAIRQLFDELAGEFAALPRPASVALVWEPGRAPVISSDRRKLKTVLKNLIGNALKFTPAGNVRVECRMTAEGCELRVIDTGIGIRREDQAVVFENFRQAPGADSRRFGGAGLGLYVVRQLVEVLGGRVTLESAPGQGSVFTVTLPASAENGHKRTAA